MRVPDNKADTGVIPVRWLRGLLLAAGVGVACVILALIWFWPRSAETPGSSRAVATRALETPYPVPGPDTSRDAAIDSGMPVDAAGTTVAGLASRPKPAQATMQPAAAPLVDAVDILDELRQAAIGEWPDKHAHALAIERALQQLIALGDRAVPVIGAFLANGEEVAFTFFDPEGEDPAHASLRLGLFDALRQIGGPSALAVLHGELQATAVPAELEMLAEILEQQAPGQYRYDLVQAATETLALAPDVDAATAAGIGGTEVGRLFELLRGYGGSDAVAQLEKGMANWPVYAAVALAGLPEGAGVPSLIAAVERREPVDTKTDIAHDAGLMALQMLAQVAAENGDARVALLQQAQSGRIPAELWPRIASAVAGNSQMQLKRPPGSPADGGLGTGPDAVLAWHIATVGNQTVYIRHTAAELSATDAEARAAFIGRLLSVTADPAATDALTAARTLLLGTR